MDNNKKPVKAVGLSLLISIIASLGLLFVILKANPANAPKAYLPFGIAVFFVILFFIIFIRRVFSNKVNEQSDRNKLLIKQEADRQIQNEKAAMDAEYQRKKVEMDAEYQRKVKQIQNEKAEIDAEYQRKKDYIQQLTADYQKLVDESEQAHPYLAKLYADFLFAADQSVADYLERKSPPARVAAENVRQIAKRNRILQTENKLLQYQILFYESMFPSLSDFKEYSVEDAVDYSKAEAEKDEEKGDEEARMSRYLSHDEYIKLNDVDRYQLALDRYKQRHKTNWEIGIDYERYIGYTLEQQGYRVIYHGATMGLEDLGRDLIATKNGATYIIQCKRWSKQKEIHEKHIFQLYGSMIAWAIEHNGQEAKGVFYATTELSSTAKQYADYLGIEFRLVPPEDYPLIKCNIGRDGERIFHLPFDQQYDNVVISREKGEFFASTVKQAMMRGFRRAYRWHGY